MRRQVGIVIADATSHRGTLFGFGCKQERKEFFCLGAFSAGEPLARFSGKHFTARSGLTPPRVGDWRRPDRSRPGMSG
jgi:hypothetical protein